MTEKEKREFYKNKKSGKWQYLNDKFIEKAEYEKEQYYKNIVDDLKTSNPSKWYSKVKRMSGTENNGTTDTHVEEPIDLTNIQQAEVEQTRSIYILLKTSGVFFTPIYLQLKL